MSGGERERESLSLKSQKDDHKKTVCFSEPLRPEIRKINPPLESFTKRTHDPRAKSKFAYMGIKGAVLPICRII